MMKRAPSLVASVIMMTLVITAARVVANATTTTGTRSTGRAAASVASRHHTYFVAKNGNDGHVGSKAPSVQDDPAWSPARPCR